MYMQEGTPHQNFLGTQQRVLEYEVERKKIKDISAFVIANGVVFRYFFDHLPSELSELWSEAAKEINDKEDVSGVVRQKEAVKELGRYYELFRKEVHTRFEVIDPETLTGLTEAAEALDVDAVYTIFKIYFENNPQAHNTFDIHKEPEAVQ